MRNSKKRGLRRWLDMNKDLAKPDGIAQAWLDMDTTAFHPSPSSYEPLAWSPRMTFSA